MGFVPARMVPQIQVVTPGPVGRASSGAIEIEFAARPECGSPAPVDVVTPSCECSSRARRWRHAVAACRAHQDHLAVAAGIGILEHSGVGSGFPT